MTNVRNKKTRDSNFELLRIIAMFMVLVLHANFWAIDGPSHSDFMLTPVQATTRTIIEMLSIVSVNVFILISGWFGIKASMKGFSKFIFQCLYFYILVYGMMLLLGITHLSVKGIAECFALTKANWFIKAYIGLYILSPILNAYLESKSKREIEYMLIAFFSFQTIYGCSDAAPFIQNGYSTFSFIGLYILARYLRLYGSAYYRWGGNFLHLCNTELSAVLYNEHDRHHPIRCNWLCQSISCDRGCRFNDVGSKFKNRPFKNH